MDREQYRTGRRAFLGTLATGASFFTVPGLFAEELTRTPAQTEGPFYPDHLPLDQDNDLIILSKSLTPAIGQVTQLSGRVLDSNGSPIKGAVVEIWQVDGNGIYLHSKCPGREKMDKNFQGFGRFETASSGEYRFRTVKPVPYPGRTPHIHFKVKKGDKELLTSQCYIKGEPLNERDGVFRGIRDPKEREAILVAFNPIPGSKTNELAAKFDIILGVTPGTS
ncbi:MAG: protocatechuate 3,4-dioxygenase beta subunit [Armatimonadetes bacterium]|jgi:protocatechuate 3,4-dioxygenase beta subunit|nr:protocatechuate 3,4-dioxygenase beta subunit [Armatimonadota bacterium]